MTEKEIKTVEYYNFILFKKPMPINGEMMYYVVSPEAKRADDIHYGKILVLKEY